MEYKEISYANEEEWHNIRQKHIGGSDCSIIMGHNPYNEDIQELWQIKTGRKKQKDISDVPAVKNGILQEPHLRGIFESQYPEFEVKTLDKTLVSLKYPFMAANLDGVLENKTSKEKGVLEIKTARCMNWKQFERDWKNEVPLHYHLQVQHYLAVTGWKFAVLFANIKLEWTDESILKKFYIERDEDDIKEIIKKEIWFNSFVINDIEPPSKTKLMI